MVAAARQEVREQHFVSLTIKNVLGVKSATITRAGPVTTIGGKNAQGKSSILKTFQMIVGGGSYIPDNPIRAGEKKGEGVLETTDYRMELKLRAGGRHEIEVKTKDGATLPLPATFLRQLTAGRAFDPLEFQRMKPDEQLATLKRIVGLDFAKLDAEHDELFAKRTEVNRDAKAIKSRVDAAKFKPGLPEAEVSVAELARELEARLANNAANAGKRLALDQLRQQATAASAKIADLERQLDAARASFADLNERGKALSAEVKALVDQDTAEPLKSIETAEETNRDIRENAVHRKLVAELESVAAQSTKLSERLNAIDAEKSAALASAKFPVPGLGFTEDGVTFNGLPFAQASSAERMRASVAIGIALNPGLRLLAIDNGEQLDEDQHALLCGLAEEQGCDLLVARVSTGPECSFVIEDGEVKPAAGAESTGTSGAKAA